MEEIYHRHEDMMLSVPVYLGVDALADSSVNLKFVVEVDDKNIYSALGFHWIWNFALYNVVGMNLSGIEAEDALFRMSVINDFLAGKGYGIESSPVTTVVLGVILFLIALRGKGREKNGLQQ